MKTFKQCSNMVLFSALFIMTFFMGGCGDSSCEDISRPPILSGAPIITSTDPVDNATGVLLNKTISATPSEALDPATVNTDTFTLTLAGGTDKILGTVTYANNIMYFNPAADLDPNTEYTATVTTGVTDVAGNALDDSNGLNVWSFTTGTAIDDIPPEVILTDPVNNATGVLLNKTITATLSEALDPATVNTDTFTLTLAGDTVEIDGTVTYANNIMYFNPTADLDPNTEYTATVTTGVTDVAGNALDDSNGLNVWNFTTGTAIDTTPPEVILTDPVNNATGVLLNKTISATLSEALDPATVNTDTFTLTLAGDTVEIVGTVTYTNNMMYFNPAADLAPNTEYTATVTTGVTDVAGNALDDSNGLNVWSFTTGTAIDTTPPEVILTDPDSNEVGVLLNKTLSATPSEPLDPATVNTGTFTLTLAGDTVEIDGTVTYINNIMRFNPAVDLTADTEYTATVTTGIKDLDGNNMLADYVWNFTTSIPGVGPASVDLGIAGDFAILTKAGITNVPTSDITGDIGSSPITAAAMNNVTCAEITGSIYGVDAAYTGSGDITCYKGTSTDKTLVDNAVLDMEIAYTDAAGRTPATGANLNIDGGILDSTTPAFAPGLYTWGTDVTITDSITLTGNADDTWIFQISGNLVLASGAQIILGPDVNPENIVWQVAGTNVTIGTNAQFSGIILAKELIAVQTGASVDGRLLAQTEVTLDQTVITEPAP